MRRSGEGSPARTAQSDDEVVGVDELLGVEPPESPDPPDPLDPPDESDPPEEPASELVEELDVDPAEEDDELPRLSFL